jgi:hypothetical protein
VEVPYRLTAREEEHAMLDRTSQFAIFAVALVAFPALATLTAIAGADDRIPDSKVVRWVEKAVAERQPRPEEKRFDEIGWVTDLRTAIQLGKEHHRPIFLNTGGGRINMGRC